MLPHIVGEAGAPLKRQGAMAGAIPPIARPFRVCSTNETPHWRTSKRQHTMPDHRPASPATGIRKPSIDLPHGTVQEKPALGPQIGDAVVKGRQWRPGNFKRAPVFDDPIV